MATIVYDAEVRHDGKTYALRLPHLHLPVCSACGEKYFTETVDEDIRAELRSHLGLLSPEEIRTAMVRLRLTQKDVADRLGFAEATLSRWMTGVQIQSRTSDNLLRLFFAFPEVRRELQTDRPDPKLGHADVIVSHA